MIHKINEKKIFLKSVNIEEMFMTWIRIWICFRAEPDSDQN